MELTAAINQLGIQKLVSLFLMLSGTIIGRCYFQSDVLLKGQFCNLPFSLKVHSYLAFYSLFWAVEIGIS